MENNLLSVCILVKNNFIVVTACIESVIANTAMPFEIIVWDDNSDEVLSFNHEKVKVYRSEETLGSPVSMNECVKKSNGNILVTLDSDTLVESGWDLTMYKYLCLDKAGVVCACSNNGTYGIQKCETKYDVKFGEVQHAAMFCAMTYRKVWDEIGGWDADFTPGYYEDTYYCYRARKLGYKVYVVPQWIKHIGAGAFGVEKREALMARNKIKYFQKVEEENLYIIHLIAPVDAEAVTINIKDLSNSVINNVILKRREE